MKQSKPIIGVTGITGSGTSTVSAILADAGGFVISADNEAHKVMQKGEDGYNEILQHFSESILAPDGEIDRKKLGGIVFDNPAKLKLLESIIHPKVIERIHSLLSEKLIFTQESPPNLASPFAVIDAPLLVEAGIHKLCNSVWLVTATDDTRLGRIMARDNINIDTAKQRLNSRAGDGHIRPFADVIIENNSGIAQLRSNVMHYFLQLTLKGIYK